MNFVYLVPVIISLCFFNGNATISKAKNRCHGRVYFSSAGFRYDIPKLNHDVEKTKIPLRFDAREKWPKCKSLFHIKDQGICGGCWAFASSSVMADRICIHTNQMVQFDVSTQDLLECCERCWAVQEGAEDDNHVGGCAGGFIPHAFIYWITEGVVSGSYHDSWQGCKPLNEGTIKGIPEKTCRKKCTNENYPGTYNNTRVFSEDFFILRHPLKDGLEQIQIELMKNGPVVASILTYDYMSVYGKNAVMSYEPEKLQEYELNRTNKAYHAIKIIGWDVTEEGTPVWIIANSWGEDWCDSGFCRIKRGTNELTMEDNQMIGAVPFLPPVSKEDGVDNKTTLQPAPAKHGVDNKKKFDVAYSFGPGLFICSLSLNVISTLVLYFL